MKFSDYRAIWLRNFQPDAAQAHLEGWLSRAWHTGFFWGTVSMGAAMSAMVAVLIFWPR